MQECNRCLYNDTIPSIRFDDDGVCNYCRLHDALEIQYPIGEEGNIRLEALAADIKEAGKGKAFDAVVGVSGGKDSSYLLYLADLLGLRVLAVHYDNGWDTTIAKHNIEVMTNALEIPLLNYRVKQEEVDDLIRAFLYSHTQDAEAATDLGLAKCLMDAATKYKVKYVLDGHSFRTEGFAPLGWSYMDGRYIKSVHQRYGKTPLKTYPLLTLTDQLRYALKGIKRPRPLYYIDYNCQKVNEFLTKSFGWEWYGGHHLENTWTAFFDYYYRLNKLGYDGSLVELSALIRSGQITKEQAIEKKDSYTIPLEKESQIIYEVRTRLGISEEVFKQLMDPNIKRTHLDWKTYRNHFRRMKPIFWIMAKAQMIPDSFYIKYCKGVQ